jgi:hypothetical protein
MSYDDNCTPAQKTAFREYWELMYEDTQAKTLGWDGMQRVMAEFRAETKTLGWAGMQRVMAEAKNLEGKQAKQDEAAKEEYRLHHFGFMAHIKAFEDSKAEKEAKIDSQKKFTKFIDDEEAKILESKILEQAEIDAKQAKQDEAAKEKFRLSYVALMARRVPNSKKLPNARRMAKAKKLADEQAKIDAKQAKIDALPPIGKFARKFWIVVGIEIARLSELYNNA